jgi:hypothetical protein
VPPPSPRSRFRSRRRSAAAALVLLTSLAACSGDDDGGADGLPAVEGTAAPEAYRIVYEVTTPEERSQEEVVVRRPFASSVTERDADGDVVSQRLAQLGLLATITGGEATAVETALAPAAADLRLDRFGDRLVEAGRLERGDDGAVGGRPCRRIVEPDAVATDGSGGAAQDASAADGSFPVVVTRCVDAVGLVLEERIATPGGQAVRTKRAVELEVGDGVPEVDVPDVEPLPEGQGGGSVEELTGGPPMIVSWRIAAPEGFRPSGSYVVVPARLGAAGGAAGDVALVTEVWQRGADVLLLDQGRATAGATPFDPASALEPVDLPGIGPATLAVDLRLGEVRITGADGAFVRVAGTLPLDELLAVARTLQPAS